MTTRYAKDDDWGDWVHETRKARALDRRLDAEQELELAKARAVARQFDAVLAALDRTFHDVSDTCQRCGAKHRGTGCRCSEG